MNSERFPDFASFYPFYLSQHENRICRRMHFIGSSLAIGFLLSAAMHANAWYLLAAVICPYAFAWIGHFVFEKNRSATFTYPLWSFCGDWKMFAQMLKGELSF